MTAPERAVRMWLVRRGFRFRCEAKVDRFRIDFVVETAPSTERRAQSPDKAGFRSALCALRSAPILLEVHGCHWHGCICRGGAKTTAQRARRRRDRALSAYCRRQGKRLLVIWEHDVRASNWRALSPLADNP